MQGVKNANATGRTPNGLLAKLQRQHLNGVLGFATKEDLKEMMSAYQLDQNNRVWMADHRFKGYVNDFMVSPRNPITMQQVMMQQPQGTGIQPTAVQNLPVTSQPTVYNHHNDYINQPSKPDQPPVPSQPPAPSQPPVPSQPPEPSQPPVAHRPAADRPAAGRPTLMHQPATHSRTAIENMAATEYQPPRFQSAEFESRRAEADREIAYFKQQKLQQMLDAENQRREKGRVANKTVEPGNKEYFSSLQPGHSALDRAMGDTQHRIEQLEREISSMNNSIPYIDPINGTFPRPPPKQQAPFPFYDPWGKGQGNPRRKANGATEGYTQIRERGIIPPTKDMAKSWPNSNNSPELEEPSRIPAPQMAPYLPSWNTKVDVTERHGAESTGTGLNTDSKFGGGGAAVLTGSGSPRTRFPTTMRKDIYGNSKMTEMDGYNPFKGRAPETTNYFPFGKPGAGAPKRDEQGKLAVNRRNIDFAHELDTSADITKRRRAADEYLRELKREMAEQKRTRDEANVEVRAPIGELATLLRQGRVGFPKRDPETGQLLDHHHHMTDITKVQYGKTTDTKKFAGVIGEDDLSYSINNARKYHTDLSRIAEERHRMRQLERMRDQREDVMHGQTWNEFWGRPGAGAPNSKDPDTSFRRSKIDRVLHKPDVRDSLMFIKNTPAGIQQLHPAHHSKSTIHSNHSNMFELPTAGSLQGSKGDYKLVTPFATLLPN